MTQVLITGGAGFIGSHLTAALRGQGHEVRVLDDLSTGHRANLDGVDAVEFIEGSVTDVARVEQAVAGCNYVFHQAAMASVPLSIADPARCHDVNATGTLNLLRASRDAGVERFVYAASSAAYGDSLELPKHEDMPVAPKSPYAISKLCGEDYVRVFADLYDIQTLAIRYFNVFGPRQDSDSPYAAVIPIFIDALVRGEEVTVNGDGEQTRDFTYIDDIVAANLLALEAPQLSGEVINVARGERTSLNQLFDTLAQLIQTNQRPHYGPTRAGDVKHSQADIGRAQALLGFAPRVPIEQGLQQTLAWFRPAATTGE